MGCVPISRVPLGGAPGVGLGGAVSSGTLVRWRGEDYSFYTTLRFEMLPVTVQAQAGLTNVHLSVLLPT